jgi:hypothetical protein
MAKIADERAALENEMEELIALKDQAERKASEAELGLKGALERQRAETKAEDLQQFAKERLERTRKMIEFTGSTHDEIRKLRTQVINLE